jgi:hypothetical protein
MKKPPSPISYLLAPILALGLSACASQQGPRPVASVYGASSDTQIVARGPVPADDASMRRRFTKEQTAVVSSKTTASGQTLSEKSEVMISSDTPAAAKPPATQETTTDSTETTTVVGSSAVAAPDSEVKFSNQ